MAAANRSLRRCSTAGTADRSRRHHRVEHLYPLGPDVGLVDLTLLSRHAHYAAACIDIPLICDADTGYGNELNAVRTGSNILARYKISYVDVSPAM